MKTKTFALRPNFRFWSFINNDWVRLTLRPGQKLTWQKWNDCEEGYSRLIEIWELNDAGDLCTEQSCFDGSDCDGRSSRHWEAGFDLLTGRFVPSYDERYHHGKLIYRPVFA
jgi:hypothetical protein